MISEIIFLFLFLHTTSCCFYTSFFFLINVGYCLSYPNYTYASIFLCLFATSFSFYLYKEGFYLDQLSILLTVFYGGQLFFCKEKNKTNKTLMFSLIAVGCFATILYLFYYGFITQRFCYGPYGNQYHSLVHILTSIGHAAVLSI